MVILYYVSFEEDDAFWTVNFLRIVENPLKIFDRLYYTNSETLQTRRTRREFFVDKPLKDHKEVIFNLSRKKTVIKISP